MRKLIMGAVALGFLTAPVLMLQGCGSHHSNHVTPPVVVKPIVVVPSKVVYPAIPAYPAGVNSYGKLDVICKGNDVAYTLSYACYRTSVRLSAKVDGSRLKADKQGRLGGPRFTFYEQGHFTKGNGAATIAGTVTGGNPGGTYVKVCP